MRAGILTVLFGLLISYGSGQIPFYYKLNKIQGTIYDKQGEPISVDFHSRRKLIIKNCRDPELDTFLRTLTLVKYGRKSLEHLLTTPAKISIIISQKIGIMYREGKYRLMGGMTGPDKIQFNRLITNKPERSFLGSLFVNDKYLRVYEENTIEIFKGLLVYSNDTAIILSKENVKLVNGRFNEEIELFSIDTIKIEPLMYPDMMYKNTRELYFFTGTHEIYHTTPANIEIQEANGNPEIDALELERQAFRLRKKINNREIKR